MKTNSDEYAPQWQWSHARDKRYTIDREFTGHASGRPQFVIRFCGEWIDSRSTFPAAVLRAVGHKAARNGAIEGIST